MPIGENIRTRRRELRLSQQQLADLLDYKNKSTIAKIEKGYTELTFNKIESIANVLNTTVEYLLTGIRPNSANRNMVFTMDELPFQNINDTVPKKPKVTAVVLAGGRSTRNQQNTPNQFVSIKGKPVIVYVLEAYQKHPAVDDIYIVSLSGWENIISVYAKNYGIDKLKGIIPGGDTGAKSVKAAVEWLSAVTSYEDIIIIQESTRPMVTDELISNTIRCTEKHGSAITFESMNEYLQFINNDESGIQFVDRSKLISIQSPEAYRFGKLHRAILDGIKVQHAFDETCCAMIMYNLGRKLVFCEGNRYNLKIVRQEDIKFIEALLEIAK